MAGPKFSVASVELCCGNRLSVVSEEIFFSVTPSAASIYPDVQVSEVYSMVTSPVRSYFAVAKSFYCAKSLLTAGSEYSWSRGHTPEWRSLDLDTSRELCE